MQHVISSLACLATSGGSVGVLLAFASVCIPMVSPLTETAHILQGQGHMQA